MKIMTKVFVQYRGTGVLRQSRPAARVPAGTHGPRSTLHVVNSNKVLRRLDVKEGRPLARLRWNWGDKNYRHVYQCNYWFFKKFLF